MLKSHKVQLMQHQPSYGSVTMTVESK